MAVGLSTTGVANKMLDLVDSASVTGYSSTYVQLHTGDPGSAGTSNVSAETTRDAITWAATSGGSKAISGTLEWASWDAGTETISLISIWDASSGGTFIWSGALTTSKSVSNTDTLQITSLTLSLTPLAA